jgi:hypothetical protein
MSILGALKVQKANQQSIADLAALPQNQIIRLAQMGQIPSDVVPVVISEKARMAKEAANMRAAQQTGGGEMPTVIEQAMQANAQQEMPRAAESGVAGIPLGQMFQEKNFKSGGIVAFQSGGVPSAADGQDDLIKSYRYINSLLNEPQQFKKYADLLRKEGNATEKDKGFSNSDIANTLSEMRNEVGLQINTSGPSDEMRAGEEEARFVQPSVPLEPVNLGLAAAPESQNVAPPVGIAAALQDIEPAAVTAAENPAPQAVEPADTNPYIQDPNDPSAGYRPGPGSVDMDSDIYKMGMAEMESIYAPQIAALDAEAQARRAREPQEQAEEARSRAAAAESIRQEFGDDAAAYYLKHGHFFTGASVQEPAPAAARFLAPADAAFSRQLAENFANDTSNLNLSRAPAAAAPVVQADAQPPAGLAAAMTGRTSTAEGRAGEAEAARRADGEAPTAAAAPKGFEEVLANIRRAYGGPETANITPERKAYLDMLKAGSMSPRDIERQQGMRFLQAGLGVLGGKSRYALQNIGEGSKEALQGYAEDLKAQRTQKLAEAKSAAEIADLRRAEQRQEVNTALDVYGKQLEREQRAKLAAERTSVADRFAKNYVAKMKKSGDTRPEEDLLDEGYVRYLEEAGQAQERITQSARTAAAGQGVQLAGQDVTREGQRQSARATVMREWNDMKMTDPIRREYNRLANQDKENAKAGRTTTLAEDYKQRQITSGVNSILGGAQQPAAQPRPGAGASAAPSAPLGTASNPIIIQ